MTWKDIWPNLVVFMLGAATGVYVYASWLPDKPPRVYNAQRNECLCDTEQTCPFGPGVVGVQRCRTDAAYNNVWGKCEPDPRWRKPE